MNPFNGHKRLRNYDAPTSTELAENITLILDFIDEVLEEDSPENEEGILEMKAVLEDWLDEIEP